METLLLKSAGRSSQAEAKCNEAKEEFCSAAKKFGSAGKESGLAKLLSDRGAKEFGRLQLLS